MTRRKQDRLTRIKKANETCRASATIEHFCMISKVEEVSIIMINLKEN